ncbi:MAG: polyphosphate kinase 1 [Clostridiales bacterium]|nr:polyphosphate kinase 1 [Clostridiales bacterium]
MESTCLENRELSWLRFNERVLEEAEDERVPLCERLTFLSIFQSNLDEFFMVRIGSLHDQMLLDKEARENKTHMTPGEQITAATHRIRQLCSRRDAAYHGLMEKLEEQGVSVVNFRCITKETERALEKMFRKDFMPVLSSVVVTKKQSFPFLNNKQIYAFAVLETRGEKKKIGVVPCESENFPRLIEVPDRKGCYILCEEFILHFLPLLFPGYRIAAKALARVTRNADIDADSIYDEDLNYRDHMAEVCRLRQKLCPVRLELSRQLDADIVSMLCVHLKLDLNRVFEYDAPLNMSFLFQIEDMLRSHGELFYAPRHPQNSSDIDDKRPVFDQILEKDVLLHYPYQSIRPFLRLLHEAAQDPEVTSIRMTLYRLARDSKVVEALVEAAENGKRVDVLVELKARFDEENNIEWSRRLERAGCHVIYGIERLKVHSKLCLITRQKADGTIQRVTQVGTGNYNEKTSRLYTDLSHMTAREDIADEAAQVFEALIRGETVDYMSTLLVAPHCLQNKLIDLIDGEIRKAESGEKGHIRLKMNSLTDKTLIRKLIEASKAGVQIEMIIRGICCLRGGVPGMTDNIRIISIVGRFLEHSRIYAFGDGDEARMYISSADWMTRNTLRRVEVATPILAPKLKKRIDAMFDLMWKDNVQARDQQPDGSYTRRYPGTDNPVSSQNLLYDEAYRQALLRK